MAAKNLIYKYFNNKDLMDHALTHRSWVNENPGQRTSNERLEFLGDAILEYVVSKKIFDEFPKKEEGYLTALRANLVNTKNLSEVARELHIGNILYLSKGEEDGGGRDNSSLLADTVEAIIGALFLDGGLDKSEQFIQDNVLNSLKQIAAKPLKDAKSTLQELIQADGLPAPKYSVTKEDGPDHNKEFTVEALVGTKSIATAKGKSKGEAEQNAARLALALYQNGV